MCQLDPQLKSVDPNRPHLIHSHSFLSSHFILSLVGFGTEQKHSGKINLFFPDPIPPFPMPTATQLHLKSTGITRRGWLGLAFQAGCRFEASIHFVRHKSLIFQFMSHSQQDYIFPMFQAPFSCSHIFSPHQQNASLCFLFRLLTTMY